MGTRGPAAGSGSYGQACMQCFKAKCRCVARPYGAACERCLRLKKQCQPSNSVRRRTSQNRSSGADIAKLEGRVNTITTMLQSVMEATGVSANSPSAPSEFLGSGGTAGAIGSTSDQLPALPSPSHSEGSAQPPPHPLEPPLYELSLQEADWYLDRFRTRMLPHFPFIDLPLAMTAQHLCWDRPFLMQAIIVVATPSTQQKLARAERLKQILTRFAVLENQSNIDMLLSILTYITWSTDPFLKPANNLSRMTMLAISLVYDLQLAKPPPPDAHVIAIMTPGFERPGGNASDTSLHSALERHRAFLACFVLSSIISASFGRMVALRWTAQMEEGLQLVEASTQCDSDGNFAVQVRLQVFIQRAAHVRDQHEADRTLATTTATMAPASANLYIKILQGQLKELRDSLSPSLVRRDMLLIYAHYAELCMNEVTRVASSEEPLLALTTQPPGNGSGPHLPALEHIECLWRSVYAIKSWLEAFHMIPPSAYLGFPFFFWFQLVRCTVILKHLSTFKDPAWDCEAVRNVVDMSQMLDWMAENAELASKEAGEQSDDDLFRRVCKMLRMSQGWMIAKQKATAQAAEGPDSLHGDGARLDTPGDYMIVPADAAWMGSLENGEEAWLEEILGWPMATI